MVFEFKEAPFSGFVNDFGFSIMGPYNIKKKQNYKIVNNPVPRYLHYHPNQTASSTSHIREEELRAHDYLDVNETISYIREHFDHSFSVRDIHTTYKSLFAHDTSGGLAKRQGKRVLVLNVDKEAEIEFIRSNVADEPSLTDYIALHNAHFGTNYTSKTFTHRFCNLFQMQGRSLCYRQVNGVRIPILRLL